jgi:two-component system LytT family sensor kinase
LLLLPFVENSFKHGAGGTTGDVQILIKITLRDNQLSYIVQNTLDADADLSGGSNGESGGIGLRNVQRQLALIYPEQHQLTTSREYGFFTADLKIDLSASLNNSTNKQIHLP